VSKEKGYAVNQILGAMPDDQNIKMLSVILEKHPNSDVRYNVAYIISNYKNESAFNALTKDLAIEKDDLVFGNVIAGAMNLAGVDTNKILQLYNNYNDLTDSLKAQFNLMLTSITDDTYGDKNIKSAWKIFLQTKVNEGSEIDKKNANEILIGAYIH
jgi:hypothetical protein